MRAQKLILSGIRGFSTPRSFDLGERITIIYGANGSGKSSICEAWDWVYTNETIADTLEPKSETKLGFKNLHAATAPACRIELIDGTTSHFLERKNFPGVLTHNLPKAPSGLSPVVLQYRLQKAIYSSEGDRTRFFTTILGLQKALDLHKKLESLRRATEKEGISAIQKWKTITDYQAKLNHQAPYPTVESPAQIDANENDLLHLLGDLLQCGATESEVIAAVKAQAHAPTSMTVTVSKLIPAGLLTPDAVTLLQEGSAAIEAITKIDQDSAKRSNWLAQGLAVVVPPTCAFCGEPTITPERLKKITLAKEQAAESASAFDKYESIIKRAKALVDAGNKTVIKELEAEFEKVVQAITELDPGPRKLVDEPLMKAQAAVAEWKAVAVDATWPLRFAAAIKFVDAMAELNAAVPEIQAALKARLRPLTVAQLKFASLQYFEDPERATWKKALDDARLIDQVAQVAKKELDKLLKENAESVRDDIIRWYKILRPFDTTPLVGLDIETGTNIKVKVHAETHGAKGPASAIFSHSNVNALGMACHIARLLKAGHRTIVLDDPTQALDPKNRHTFERDFIKNLLDEGLQVVILTHDMATARNLLDEYQALDPAAYSFDVHTKDGPIVTQLYGDANHLLRQALDALESRNIGQTEAAAIAVRKLAEQAVCEFLRYHGATIPAKATFGHLLKELDKLGAGKTPKAAVMKLLNDINDRISNPLHHPPTGKAMTLADIATDLRDIIELRRNVGQLRPPGAQSWPTDAGISKRLKDLVI